MADASHELRTPVSVVQTAAQVTLSQGDRDPDEYRQSLTIVAEQAEQLARLVNDMFLLARAEAHGVFLRTEFVELDEIVDESVRALRVLAQQRGVTVTRGGAEAVGLSGDSDLLHRLVTNLLDNAIRHAAEAGGVSADVQCSDGHAILRITNDDRRRPPGMRRTRIERARPGDAAAKLPAAVLSAFRQAYPTAEIKNVQERDHGKTAWEVESLDAGLGRDLVFDATGTGTASRTSSRSVTIDFKQTAPSKLYWSGRPAMRVVQALQWLKDTLPADPGRSPDHYPGPSAVTLWRQSTGASGTAAGDSPVMNAAFHQVIGAKEAERLEVFLQNRLGCVKAAPTPAR